MGGEYQWRREGEYHLFNPETVFKLQHATRAKRYDIFKEYTALVDDQSRKLATLRGLFELQLGARPPVPDRRGRAGLRDRQALLHRGHELRLDLGGGPRDAGHRHEPPRRQVATPARAARTPSATCRLPNGDSRRSAIKQVASGRFGVTSEYLVNADDLQIKMAQGAKPGEGGQLPGHKVYPWIAKTRHSTPGVGLISPPPHHDIYSIEDLEQLIHDLKNANPRARVHVKLVAEVGVGTVAAGVSKAHADVVLISGHDGGTGASPLTSLKHAGAPWELGLAETQQTLLLNGLRDRIVVQVDGQMKTGRDVVIAALLGAEEFGFATAPLVVSGCVMMRVCHLDTCPVGVATQNPELRQRFTGKPEFVVNFFEFIAEEVRELLAPARLPHPRRGHRPRRAARHPRGRRPLEGRRARPVAHPRTCPRTATARRCCAPTAPGPRPRPGPRRQADRGRAGRRSTTAQPVRLEMPIRNVNRTVGTMLGSEVTRRYGGQGLPDGTIDITSTGSAGQSFGAFLPRGITLRLEGDANDYLGKGLSGGRVIVHPDRDAPLRRRGEHHRRQRHRSTAPPAARCSSAAWWASGSACATPAPPPWSRAWATTAAST